MRKSIAVLVLASAFSASAFSAEAVKQYELKDGTTLIVYSDGKMTHQNKYGNSVQMKEGQVMETKDGQKIMMKGNEIWRLEQNRPIPG
ncbi:MAG: CopK family periplasmic copper-binding protein [Methylococcales bacterium]|nr:CopK family periplasmic copper-binding protein [Methylococcales bacterium]